MELFWHQWLELELPDELPGNRIGLRLSYRGGMHAPTQNDACKFL